MKLMTLVLLASLVLSCTNASISSSIEKSIRKVSDNTPTTVIRSIPLNPQNILKDWKPLEVLRYEQPNVITVVYGNPNIEWTEENTLRAFTLPAPEGSIASAVAITLAIDPYRRVVITSFWFINPLGINEFYIHDDKINKFVREPDESQKFV